MWKLLHQFGLDWEKHIMFKEKQKLKTKNYTISQYVEISDLMIS